MIGGKWRHALAGGSLAALLALGVPAVAQNFSDGYKFLEAVDDKDITEAEKLIGRPGSTLINSRDISNGRTGLHITVERRDISWLSWLLTKGANPNIADNRGITPLMLASQRGFFEGVETLIAARARVDESNEAGETPLISAVHRRDVQMMRALLKAGADPDRADNSGRSAREYATLEGSNSQTLAEIERSAKPSSGGRQSGEVYGPSF
ncbi:MAG TPA: ankyrin repeat domain-containing protein [Croceibacterium sp.]